MEPVEHGNRHGAAVAGFPMYGNVAGPTATLELPGSFDAAGGWQYSERVRRALNVLAALALLIIAAPLMLVVALLVRLTSAGPVLYTQPRVGLDRRRDDQLNGNWRRKVDYGGRVFQIYKFRTMHVGSDRTGQRWASRNDPRLTPVGGFLRKYRLDELPQLINVVKGDMNLVGPRPEQPTIFLELRDQIDRYPSRQRVLPGITGLAQISQHYDSCLDDVKSKLRYDLEYMNRCSPTEDLRIMARTVPVVLLKKGAW